MRTHRQPSRRRGLRVLLEVSLLRGWRCKTGALAVPALGWGLLEAVDAPTAAFLGAGQARAQAQRELESLPPGCAAASEPDPSSLKQVHPSPTSRGTAWVQGESS